VAALSSKVRQCPNCRSFVVTDQEFCPRCDARLDSAPGPADSPVDQWMRPPQEKAEEQEAPLDLLPDEPTALLADEAPEQPRGEPAALLMDEAPELTLDDTHHDRLPTERLPLVEIAAPDDETPQPLSDEEQTLSAADEGFEDQFAPFEDEEPTIQDTSPRLTLDEPPLDTTDPHDWVTQDYAAPSSVETMIRDARENTPARQTQIPYQAPNPAAYIIPPAPYTPPPVPVPIPMPAPPPMMAAPVPLMPPPQYGPRPMSGTAYLQQRGQAYQRAGYQIEVSAPYEAALRRGKPLSFQAWMLALVSIIGFVWYVLIQMMSGFGKDHVYVTLEPDGRVYEDGPGAAHIRRQRSRTGRRWSIFGFVLLSVSLIVLLILAGIGAAALSQDRFQYALRKAYPAVSLFEDRLRSGEASDADIELMKNGAVVFSIVGGIGLLGLWGGATLFVVGAVHASAYRSKVPPLPGYA